MSSSDLAVSVRNLSKTYMIRHNLTPQTTAVDAIAARLRKPLQRSKREVFWALRDISLEIRQGEVLGLVGHNGAGKSTLLKILSRITVPTSGAVDLYGRVGSLLEVGTGFHPELTGRENVYLNGAILGMRRREIARRFDDIVTFAGVERFLDTPVKRYSSGMYVRLAFAVAAHLDTDILIVDEVLAVGDQEFQARCLARMRDVAEGGRTIIFVSHNLQAVRQLCHRAAWLEMGRVRGDGDVDEVLASYAAASLEAGASRTHGDLDQRAGSGELRVVDVGLTTEVLGSADAKTIQFEVRRRRPYEGRFWVSAEVVDEQGTSIFQCDSRLAGHWIEASERYCGEIEIRHPWLRPGRYSVNLYLCAIGIIDRCDAAITLTIPPMLPYAFQASADASALGVVFADFAYRELPLSMNPGLKPTAENRHPPS